MLPFGGERVFGTYIHFDVVRFYQIANALAGGGLYVEEKWYILF